MMLAAIAALVGCDAFSAMEYFDHATGDTHVDFDADQLIGELLRVEDLQIVHSPEGGRGTVHLTVAAAAVGHAIEVLVAGSLDPIRLA